MKHVTKYHNQLRDAGLKVTPQRVAVLDAVDLFRHHPSSEEIAAEVRKNYPSIATGTVYNILDLLVSKDIIKRVKTEKGVMLYDAVRDKHHHLYCAESERVEDYFDEELDALLEDFFNKKEIRGFEIDDIQLQLVGKFRDKNSQS